MIEDDRQDSFRSSARPKSHLFLSLFLPLSRLGVDAATKCIPHKGECVRRNLAW